MMSKRAPPTVAHYGPAKSRRVSEQRFPARVDTLNYVVTATMSNWGMLVAAVAVVASVGVIAYTLLNGLL
jgi:hypothetical protein